MATQKAEQEILTNGTNQARIAKGAFYQNTYLRQQGWEVRQGFGQLAQFDTQLAGTHTNDSTTKLGYSKVLGSYVVYTNFQHLQVLTLLQSDVCFTGNNSTQGQFLPTWHISIYDVTSNRRWEEVLHVHTRNNIGAPLPQPTWIPQYATCKTSDHTAWLAASTTPATPFFQEYLDTVLFGSSDIGLWVYRPVDPDAMDLGQIQTDSIYANTSLQSSGQYPCYGESASIHPVVPVPGQFSDQYAYFGNDQYPANPVSVAVVQGRVAIAAGREVYFADQGKPGCIAGLNVLTVQSDTSIVAIAEVAGNLLIWSATQTWLYRVPPSYVASGGELTLISNELGCLNPLSFTKMKGAIVWASQRGIHASQGLYEIQPLSEDIAPLFQTGVSSPMTSFYVNSGATNLLDPQPRTFYDWQQTNRVSLTYDAKLDTLFVSVPDQECAWLLQQQAWVLWNFESVVNQSDPVEVGGQRRLPLTQLLAYNGQVLGVHGTETYTVGDQVLTAGDPARPEVDLSSPSGSYFITEWGRGGALDRSSDPAEDNRNVRGSYETLVTGNQFYELGKPVILPANYVHPQGTQPAQEVHLFPLYLIPNNVNPPDHLDLLFQFDNTRWTPVVRTGTAEVDAFISPERGRSFNGWGVGNPQNGLAEIQVYQGGVTNAAGNELRIRFDGVWGAAIATWTGAPDLNVIKHQRNALIWLPFKYNAPVSGDSMSLGIAAGTAQQVRGGGVSALGFVAWCQAKLGNKLTTDAASQPVDYAIKSEQINIPNQQVRTRGIFASVLSHGRVALSSMFGQLNFLAGSDWKDWVSQIVDYSGTNGGLDDNLQNQAKSISDQEAAPNSNTIRIRHRAGTGAMTQKVLNRALQWGEQGSTTQGNYLIDDEQVDSIALSDSVKGESVTWMVYGHMMSRAERLVFTSVRAQLEPAGTQRRIGR